MKNSSLGLGLLFATFAVLSTLPGHSQILADAAADYQAGTYGDQMSPVTDSHGGSWTYYMAEVTSDSGDPGAITSETALTYTSNGNDSVNDFYGTTNSSTYPYSSGGTDDSTNYSLPGVSNASLFTGDVIPSGSLETQPGSGTDGVDLQWKAGAGETGSLLVKFDLTGPTQSTADNFAIYDNGKEIYDSLGVLNADVTGTVHADVATGTTLDFVLVSGAGVIYGSQADLGVQIEVPEPRTWAMMLSGLLVVLGASYRRLRA
jgi:hypothetical protein